MKIGKTISFYVVTAVLPYFALSWLILTVVLFLQQSGRYSEIFFLPDLPSAYIWNLVIALLPSVISFTCPMALLVGVIVGLSRMQSDNEIIAIRTFGISNSGVIIPLSILGLLLSVFSIFVNIFGVPASTRVVRGIALAAAIHKLESPVEPGAFNSDVEGSTIYVRDVDPQSGKWRNVFIFNQEARTGTLRLITGRLGRLDSSGDRSELVLEDAAISTFDAAGESGKVTSESIRDLRFAVLTSKDRLIQKLDVFEPAVEELGLGELITAARTREGKEGIEAWILAIRKIVLSFAPFLFSILGAAIVLRLKRAGRGMGLALALLSLVLYFFLTFAGEQLSRAGAINVIIGGFLPVLASVFVIFFLLRARGSGWGRSNPAGFRNKLERIYVNAKGGSRSNILLDLTTGIRDFELLMSLIRYFVFAALFLAGIFLVFTAFELWRFAAAIENGFLKLAAYLGYLIPYLYLQIAPTCAMIAVIAAFTIKSRQNEILVWVTAGQSVYRLILPCLLLMLFLGIVNFGFQELISPFMNQRQDALRSQIRLNRAPAGINGKVWIANEDTILSYEEVYNASDNEMARTDCTADCPVSNVLLMEFDAEGPELQGFYRMSGGVINGPSVRPAPGVKVEHYDFKQGNGVRTEFNGNGNENEFVIGSQVGLMSRPSHLSLSHLRGAINSARSEKVKRTLSIALEKRYATLFLPFVIGLLCTPFALALDRKSRVVSVVYSVALWLVFVGVNSAFEQFGVNGALSPAIAVWAPLFLFTLVGIFLLSRVRT